MRLLIADDDAQNRYLLNRLLTANGWEVAEACDGLEALQIALADPPDLIISDLLMPRMDGYHLCTAWKRHPQLCSIPFLVYTANYTDPEDETFALRLGADRFFVKPMEPMLLVKEIAAILDLMAAGAFVARQPEEGTETDILRIHNERLVNKLEQQLAELQEANRELHATKHDLEVTVCTLEKAMGSTVRAIAKLVEARDPYTAGHQERVAELASAIALEMGLSEDEADGIRLAGQIHDIGKVYVPAEILTRPRVLTPVEFAVIKMHPAIAYDVLIGIEFPWPIAEYVLQHHERLDGSGYPKGITAEQILPGSKVLAVADVVEAMSSHRPYKPSSGIEAALEEIETNLDRLYDRDAGEACLRLFREKAFTMAEAPLQAAYSK